MVGPRDADLMRVTDDVDEVVRIVREAREERDRRFAGEGV
jgi:hypothetical protein